MIRMQFTTHTVVALICVCLFAIARASETEFFERNRYARDMNVDKFVETEDSEVSRNKRQTSGFTEEYHVTQCSHDNTELPDGPSINVKGIRLQYPDATRQAARLIHLMVRFMPRSIFLRLADNSAVGLFSVQNLPGNVFEEFMLNMPLECAANCRTVTLQDGTQYDCGARWCTTTDYPYNPGYPLNYLWAYGNFSRTFIVETNVVCRGFNPSGGAENFLMREFGLTVLTRAFDDKLTDDLKVAYEEASVNNIWTELRNVYDYFMKGTQAWFNGATSNVKLGGMSCIWVLGSDGSPLCEDAYSQRQYIKQRDSKLYAILNFVYNNNRDYVESETSVCEW